MSSKYINFVLSRNYWLGTPFAEHLCTGCRVIVVKTSMSSVRGNVFKIKWIKEDLSSMRRHNG